MFLHLLCYLHITFDLRLQNRQILEEGNELDPRVSVLEDDLLDEASSDSEPEQEPEERKKVDRERRRERSRDRDRDRYYILFIQYEDENFN